MTIAKVFTSLLVNEIVKKSPKGGFWGLCLTKLKSVSTKLKLGSYYFIFQCKFRQINADWRDLGGFARLVYRSSASIQKKKNKKSDGLHPYGDISRFLLTKWTTNELVWLGKFHCFTSFAVAYLILTSSDDDWAILACSFTLSSLMVSQIKLQISLN